MPNVMKLMKQAQQLQENLAKIQADLDVREVEFSAGGGCIRVVATGAGRLRKIELDAGAIDPADPEGLQDLILAGVNGALDAARAMVQEEVGKLTGGMGLPGFPA